jgi:putative phosphoesterase
MKLGVISDTHDSIANIDKAFLAFSEHAVQQVIHCGDFKSTETAVYCLNLAKKHGLSFLGVLGNNDLDVPVFLALSTDLHEGVVERTFDTAHVAMYHGHHSPTLRKVRADSSYDIVLLGHTHKPKIEEEPGRLIVNPGSTAFAIPRSRLWLPTIAIVDTSSMSASIVELT